jgi:hypothetical protein
MRVFIKPKIILLGLGLLYLAACSSKISSADKIITSDFEFKSPDFEEFYNLFISDSAFQVTRVKFPIDGNYQDYESEHEWTKESWKFIKWDFRDEISNSQDSIVVEQDSIKFFFGSYCVDCGFSFEMQFDKIDEQWLLTYRQENNF